MDPATMDELARRLRERRDSFMRGAFGAELYLDALGIEHESELEENAQGERITRLLDQLDARARRGIEDVTNALDRVADGTYGFCVECGDEIPVARLEALPEAERCVPCTEAAERGGRARMTPGSFAPPRESADRLSDDELEALVRETLERDDRLDLDELQVRCGHGTVMLSGALPSESERELVHKTVADIAGASNVVDEVRVQPLAWQRDDRTPDETPPGAISPDQTPAGEEAPVHGRSPETGIGREEGNDVAEGWPSEGAIAYEPPTRPLTDEEPE